MKRRGLIENEAGWLLYHVSQGYDIKHRLKAEIRLRTRGKHETKTYLVKLVDQLQRAVLIK